MPKVDDQDHAFTRGFVPDLVVERIVENQALSFLPPICLFADANSRPVRHHETHMAAQTRVGGAEVSSDMRVTTKNGEIRLSRPTGPRHEVDNLGGARARGRSRVDSTSSGIEIQHVPAAAVGQALRLCLEVGVCTEFEKFVLDDVEVVKNLSSPGKFRWGIDWLRPQAGKVVWRLLQRIDKVGLFQLQMMREIVVEPAEVARSEALRGGAPPKLCPDHCASGTSAHPPDESLDFGECFRHLTSLLLESSPATARR